MATIRSIPEEILWYIFKYLELNELKPCQKVCRSWYSVVHCLLLRRIAVRDIDQFIRSIDSNPKDSYLKAVKEISIYRESNDMSEPYKLTKQVIQKLFCRFTNLKSVTIEDDLLEYGEFNDDTCKTILKSCPQLKVFDMSILCKDDNQDHFLDTLLKLRLLITHFHLEGINFATRPESAVEFLTSFPRLAYIDGIPNHLDNFQKLLPAVTELPNVKYIDLKKLADDIEDFAEDYLATLTKDKEEQLLKNLSNITRLNVRYAGTFNLNSNKFINKYLNKLECFSHISYENYNLSTAQKQSFCHDIISLACSVSHCAGVRLSDIPFTDVAEILQVTSPILFHSNHQRKVLELIVNDGGISNLTVKSNRTESLRQTTLDVPNQISLKNIIANLNSKFAPINHVNKLLLDLSGFNRTIPTIAYFDIFDMIPSLEEVIIEVPERFSSIRQEQTRTYPHVDNLTVRSSNNDQCQTLLDKFLACFPNLRYLTIFYFCGTFSKEKREIQLHLANNCTLDKLTLDITPIMRLWRENWRKEIFEKILFIVVQVGKQMYKVTLDGRRPKCIHIAKSDLKGFTHGKDYVRLHIVGGDVKRLDIMYWAYGTMNCQLYIDFYRRGMAEATVFNRLNQ